mgnify:CR=1 FL=1
MSNHTHRGQPLYDALVDAVIERRDALAAQDEHDARPKIEDRFGVSTSMACGCILPLYPEGEYEPCATRDAMRRRLSAAMDAIDVALLPLAREK